MSAINIESHNAMATKRAGDYPSAFMNHQNGLIKSASTSSCSAHENALLRSLRASRYATNGQRNGCGNADMAANCNERLKLFVLQPFSHSEQNMLAAEMDTQAKGSRGYYRNHGGAALKSFYANSKHLSDYAALGHSLTSPCSGKLAENNSGPSREYSSHRTLDNVLVNRSNNSAIMNFTAVNGYHGNQHSDNPSNMRSKEAPAPSAPASKSSHESLGAESKQCDNSEVKLVEDAPTVPVAPNKVSPNTSRSEMPKLSTVQAPAYAHSSSPPPFAPAPSQNESDSNSAASANSIASSKDGTPEPHGECAGDEEEEKSVSKKEKPFRRSSSLKMPKESTTNPAQKKIVRFADAMGLDLTNVRTFLDELPSVPRSAYSDLQDDGDFDLQNAAPATPTVDRLFGGVAPAAPASRSLVPMFKQPGISHNFLERVRDQNVCLEKAVVGTQPVCSITGTVRVRNVDFHKSVYVRYTLDNWRSFGEVQAVYVPDSCDGFSDQFSFIIYLYELPSSQRVELAVRYHCSGCIFWDNNLGANYVFQTSSSPPPIPSYFACVQTANDRCHSFY